MSTDFMKKQNYLWFVTFVMNQYLAKGNWKDIFTELMKVKSLTNAIFVRRHFPSNFTSIHTSKEIMKRMNVLCATFVAVLFPKNPNSKVMLFSFMIDKENKVFYECLKIVSDHCACVKETECAVGDCFGGFF